MQTKDKVSNNEFKIKIIGNGPYLISGGIPMFEQIIGIDAAGYSREWRKGKRYPELGKYTLCRCGQSKNKPFCDGTHLKVNFGGTETASRELYINQVERVKGRSLELTDAQELCSVARFCERAGGIWSLVRQSDNPRARRIAIEEAGNCPSGRLVVWDKEGRALEPEFEPSIVVVEDPQEDMNGPIWVRGRIPVESANGRTYEIRNRVALCRCGKSSNKPFCDGSHCKQDT